MIDVSFNDEYICESYGFILTNKTISNAEPQTNLIEVPGRNGSIDMSEVLTGNVRYKNRTISLVLWIGNDFKNFELIASDIRKKYNGKTVSIIFSDDLAFYWYGRVIDIALDVSGNQGTLKITCSVDPYKHSIESTADDWLWDPFDFETGEISDDANINVSGIAEYELNATGEWANPIIVSDSVIGYSIELSDGSIVTGDTVVGSKVIYDCIIKEGKNKFTFTGNGTISIVYRGGSL